MLFPKENQPVSDTSSNAPVPSSGSGLKVPILFGAVLALVGASVYLFYQLSELRTELGQTRDALEAKISEIHETSTVSTQTSRRTSESLKKDIEKYRAQAAQLSGQAKIDATKHADDLAARLEKVQVEQGKQVAAVTTEVSQVKSDTSANNAKIGEVSTEVGSVKTDVAKTKTELEKTIADLKSTRVGDQRKHQGAAGADDGADGGARRRARAARAARATARRHGEGEGEGQSDRRE